MSHTPNGGPDRSGQGGARAAGEPHGDPARWAPRLRRILDEQRALYDRLDALSIRQSELVLGGATDELLAVLGERQIVVDQIWSSSDEFAPFQRRWAELMSALPAEQRLQFSAVALELAEIIERIAERDDADRRELERQRATVAAEISSLNRGRTAVAAYGGGAAGAPGTSTASSEARFQDREV